MACLCFVFCVSSADASGHVRQVYTSLNKCDDFLLKNDDLILENDDLLLKNDNFILNDDELCI